MAANLTCTQVSALLSFYIDDKLSNQLKEFVEEHLAACPACRAKLESLKNMLNSLREIHQKLVAVKPVKEESSQNDLYRENLSAYIDNELDDIESIKMKKQIISNPQVRQELEAMYNLKKVLHNSFEKTKNEAKDDFSKLILREMDLQEEVYGPDSFAKVVALFILIFVAFTLTAVIIFWI